MVMMMTAMLICCSLLNFASLTQLACGENLTHPRPSDEGKLGGSWADLRLPFYTAGFE